MQKVTPFLWLTAIARVESISLREGTATSERQN
jgi:hypothetical protein